MVKAFGQVQNNEIAGAKTVQCVKQSIASNAIFEEAQDQNNQLLDIISNNLQSGYYSSYDNMKGLDFTQHITYLYCFQVCISYVLVMYQHTLLYGYLENPE